MDTWVLWFLLLQSVLQYPQPVGDGLDEVTRLRMEAWAKLQEEEKIRLEREMEQLALKQGVWDWGDLLCSALWLWQHWAVAGLLLLLLAFWYMWSKRSLRRDMHQDVNDRENENEARFLDVIDEGAGNEDGDVGNEGEEDDEDEDNDVNGEENNNHDGNVQEVNNAGAHEEGDVANGDEELDDDDRIGRMVMERIQWPVQDLPIRCQWISLLMENFAFYFRHVLSDTFYPVLQEAIGVGSAFEGWSPREEDVVYQVLVPMTPPRGHSFHLELDTAGQRRVRNFRVRVQQECTCGRAQRGKDMLCFLHQPEEELRTKQDPSLVDTLCTDSYLDVHKTARWFYQLVRAVWPALLQSHSWHLVLLPCRRSCQFQVTNGRESFRIEMLFGVRQGDSDVFVSSEPREAYTSSTVWPESYAVAEMKFFKYIARRAPYDSLHLKCLQFFTRLQLGLGFSTYTIKTIVMHLLSVVPVSQWRRRHFVRRVLDISEGLRTCVQMRRLNHFIVGNRRLPEGISLPPDVQMAVYYNLFHDLELDPIAHSQAMSQYVDLYRWLKRILDNED
ncbi:inositol 1,4,5-trisphosphate receptor-interacting protein-like 1 [Oenanthe melanoleuca]|uniref:inositol 1,4,5-trisphosphate receptor-interacting protein-like 1 n=1 Tax=Oenanthe melanoleuca TaxID=2939378 RepID=UPI0024C1B427|nr:inositol 1,4,5-trisphosphate receptor-interacting protein-like 1 [Oenanthe melanoleuca]XP_056337997.1 inositol 1,4,5-trisphosphate receptor-interacting protein-like 1 [Oenanthe melanoleuca]